MSKKNVKQRAEEHRHLILAQLYANMLENGDEYTARAMNNRTLSLDELCDNMVTIGGFQGSLDMLKYSAKALIEMAMFSVADGMTVNFGPFIVYPKIKGTFHGAASPWDREKNPVVIKARTTQEARRIEKLIDVEIEKAYTTDAGIESYTDTPSGAVNSTFSSGSYFTIIGTKIRIEGPSSENGLYFVPIGNPGAAVKIPILAVNNPSMLIGTAPPAAYPEYRIHIVTQYSCRGGNSVPLKKPRVIKSTFKLMSV